MRKTSLFWDRIIPPGISRWILAPALAWQILFLYFPLLIILASTFGIQIPGVPNLSGSTSFSLSKIHVVAIRNSLIYALLTSFFTMLIAYPIALLLVTLTRRRRLLGLILLVIPSWVSFVVEAYAWIFLMKRGGILPKVAAALHLAPANAHFVNTDIATVVVMTYCYVSLMALPIFSSLERIDWRLVEASSDLGATNFTTFKRVIFPLSLPGVVTGFLLVFIPAVGEYVIPNTVGGAKRLTLGELIVSKFMDFRDWQGGAAVSILCIAVAAIVSLLVVAILSRSRLKKIFRNLYENLKLALVGPGSSD